MTDDFVAAVLAQLKSNEMKNRLDDLKRGDDGYRISSHAELAEAIAPGQTNAKSMLARIIGPAKPTTKAKPRVATSRYVGIIRDVLELPKPKVVEISVPSDRAQVAKLLSQLTDEDFETIERAVKNRLGSK